mgnify:CR=1 FL=1
MSLDNLTIKGFKSIKELKNFELNNLNVFIGGNGSGKSNLIDFFNMISAMFKHGGLKEFIAGNADSYLYGGPKITPKIYVELRFGLNSYNFELTPTEDGFFLIKNEQRSYYDEGKNVVKKEKEGRFDFYPNLITDKDKAIASWKIYHFHDTSEESGMRRYQDVSHDEKLFTDASNIAPFLKMLRDKHPASYQKIVDTIRLVTPFFDDFILKEKEIVTAQDLSAEEHLKMQAIAQKYCDQSISKTINVPASYPFKNLKDIYMKGWQQNVIGMTTFRDQSRGSVIKELEETDNIIKHEVKLPETFLNGATKKIKREGMKFYIHFSYYPEDTEKQHPIAIWITSNQTGETKACNKACESLEKLSKECGVSEEIINNMKNSYKGDRSHNKLARMISLNLRHGISREDILVAISNIEGDNISTLLSAVRKFIAETISDGKEIVGLKCPNCQSSNIKMEAGCFTCMDCDYAGCG